MTRLEQYRHFRGKSVKMCLCVRRAIADDTPCFDESDLKEWQLHLLALRLELTTGHYPARA